MGDPVRVRQTVAELKIRAQWLGRTESGGVVMENVERFSIENNLFLDKQQHKMSYINEVF